MDIMEHVMQVKKDLRSIKYLLAAQLMLHFQMVTGEKPTKDVLLNLLKDCGVDLYVKSDQTKR